MNTISGSNILTIGCKFDPPRGGVAQVLYTYRRHVYNMFNFIQNSCDGTLIKKGLVVMFAYIKTFFFLLLHKEFKIVHIHTASYNSFKRSSIFVSLSNFMNRKVVLHIHGGGFKEYYHTNPLRIKSVLEKCDALKELRESKKCLEEWMGYSIDVFSYPNGNVGSREIEALKANGYNYAFTTSPTNFDINNINAYLLPRMAMNTTGGKYENLSKIMGVWQKVFVKS